MLYLQIRIVGGMGMEIHAPRTATTEESIVEAFFTLFMKSSIYVSTSEKEIIL